MMSNQEIYMQIEKLSYIICQINLICGKERERERGILYT